VLEELIRHSDLVEIARKWLVNKQRCPIVLTELSTSSGETPDAIGWYRGNSILIECKASITDFKADLKKDFRITEFQDVGMGIERFYLTPKGLLDPNIIPEGWGLLEYDGKHIKRIKIPDIHRKNCDRQSEILLLCSAIRRIGKSAPKGISCKYYIDETKNKATISIDTEDTVEGSVVVLDDESVK
jgi:hypothetical protein